MTYKYFTPEQVAEIKQQLNHLLETTITDYLNKELDKYGGFGHDIVEVRIDAIPNASLKISIEITPNEVECEYCDVDEYGRTYPHTTSYFDGFEYDDICLEEILPDDEDEEINYDFVKELEDIINSI